MSNGLLTFGAPANGNFWPLSVDDDSVPAGAVFPVVTGIGSPGLAAVQPPTTTTANIPRIDEKRRISTDLYRRPRAAIASITKIDYRALLNAEIGVQRILTLLRLPQVKACVMLAVRDI